MRRLGAVDAGVALYVAGQLALGATSRGLLGPHMVTVTRYDDLAALMQRSAPEWLAPATASAFGVHAGLHCLAVPIGVVGERLGVLLIVFDELAALDEDIRHVLTVVAAGLGFVVLRDRLVRGAQRRRAGQRRPRAGQKSRPSGTSSVRSSGQEQSEPRPGQPSQMRGPGSGATGKSRRRTASARRGQLGAERRRRPAGGRSRSRARSGVRGSTWTTSTSARAVAQRGERIGGALEPVARARRARRGRRPPRARSLL